MNKVKDAKTFKVNLTYTSKIVTDKDGDRFPVHRTVKIVTSHIKEYDIALPIIVNLTTCARNLILAVTRIMDSNAIVRNDVHVKKYFKNMMKEATEGRVNYSDTTINIAFSDLMKVGILLNRGKGSYKVNPKYYYRNSDVRRLDSIRNDYEYEDNKQYELQQTKTTDNDNA